jgi:hypothetical protein
MGLGARESERKAGASPRTPKMLSRSETFAACKVNGEKPILDGAAQFKFASEV